MRLDPTPIPGLLVVRLDVHEDARGWFKESWQREKMLALGLPDFEPVQHNVAHNLPRGTTRGIHAEPWDKLVSLVSGRAFGAWVDLREGDSFGTTVTMELDPSMAVFVPRGVGNSYQTLEEDVGYGYLVNDHFDRSYRYPALAVDDPTVGIAWPIPLDQAVISDKDRRNPRLEDVEPFAPRKTLVLGCEGQLGRALMVEFPGAVGANRDELDLTDPDGLAAWPWRDYDTVLNAAAYTAVDEAETPGGRRAAWAANAVAPATLARLADRHRLTLVHYSTDYVFDGSLPEHDEDEPPSPLSVYGQSKAAGDLAVGTASRHYLVRTGWVVGDGGNFVRTMQRLAREGVSPEVVDDQVGRLTFADDLARATRHLLDTEAPYGTYNCTSAGTPLSWAQIARRVFELTGRDPDDVRSVSTAEYAEGKDLAPRPRHSTLTLEKLEATGFSPVEGGEALRKFLLA